MAFDLIIRNGTLVRDASVARGDIAVADGQIVQIVPDAKVAALGAVAEQLGHVPGVLVEVFGNGVDRLGQILGRVAVLLEFLLHELRIDKQRHLLNRASHQ